MTDKLISRLESLSWWVILIPLIVMGLIMVPWHIPVFVGVVLVVVGIILCVAMMGVGLFGRNLTYWTRRKALSSGLYSHWCCSSFLPMNFGMRW